MNLVEELQKLEQLFQNGSLTAEEFTRAKTFLLSNLERPSSDFDSANTYIDHETQIQKLDSAWENQKQRFVTEQLIKLRPLIPWSIICGIVWALALFNWIFGTPLPSILDSQ